MNQTETFFLQIRNFIGDILRAVIWQKKKKIQMQVTFKYCKHFFLLTDDIVIVCFSIQQKAKQHSAFLSFMSALRITVLDLVSQTM